MFLQLKDSTSIKGQIGFENTAKKVYSHQNLKPYRHFQCAPCAANLNQNKKALISQTVY